MAPVWPATDGTCAYAGEAMVLFWFETGNQCTLNQDLQLAHAAAMNWVPILLT